MMYTCSRVIIGLINKHVLFLRIATPFPDIKDNETITAPVGRGGPRTPFHRFVHRRRIKTEEKSKVVASVWGEEFFQFLAALRRF